MKETMRASQMGTKGGLARAKSLTPKERTDMAREAVEARWRKAGKVPSVPSVTHGSEDHPLKIGDATIPCFVLEGGTRVVTQRGLQTALGMNVSGGARRLTVFLAFLSAKGIDCKGLQVRVDTPIVFRGSGGLTHGYEATVLADFCEVILAAHKADALRKQQEHYVKACEALSKGFARVGIIALVDEATGYQNDRARDALAKILEAFVAKELQSWVSTFPADFYKELCRLWGQPYTGDMKRPQFFGKLTDSLVYARIAPGVRDELRRLTPRNSDGRLKRKLFQRLTAGSGHPKLREHLSSVTTIMKLSDTKETFLVNLDRIHPKYGDTKVCGTPVENEEGKKT